MLHILVLEDEKELLKINDQLKKDNLISEIRRMAIGGAETSSDKELTTDDQIYISRSIFLKIVSKIEKEIGKEEE